MNAYEILGLAANASAEEIRIAYLNKVKEWPPDRSPEKFEEIRDAYDELSDPRKRAKAMFLDTTFTAPLVSLIDSLPVRRAFTGPKLWHEVLKAK